MSVVELLLLCDRSCSVFYCFRENRATRATDSDICVPTYSLSGKLTGILSGLNCMSESSFSIFLPTWMYEVFQMNIKIPSFNYNLRGIYKVEIGKYDVSAVLWTRRASESGSVMRSLIQLAYVEETLFNFQLFVFFFLCVFPPVLHKQHHQHQLQDKSMTPNCEVMSPSLLFTDD